jgi:hypothetical protein
METNFLHNVCRKVLARIKDKQTEAMKQKESNHVTIIKIIIIYKLNRTCDKLQTYIISQIQFLLPACMNIFTWLA